MILLPVSSRLDVVKVFLPFFFLTKMCFFIPSLRICDAHLNMTSKTPKLRKGVNRLNVKLVEFSSVLTANYNKEELMSFLTDSSLTASSMRVYTLIHTPASNPSAGGFLTWTSTVAGTCFIISKWFWPLICLYNTAANHHSAIGENNQPK